MIATQEEFEKLVTENQNFAYSVVKNEFGQYPWDVKQDLNSAAVAGLVYAATKYDPKRANECKFISYAIHWIRYYVNEEIRRQYPVKFNQNFVSKRNKIMRCVNAYKKDHNDEMPSIKYISDQVNMSEKVVQNVLNINGGENYKFLSFNVPVTTKDNESEQLTESKIIKEYLKTASADDDFSKLEVHDILNCLKKEVTSKEYDIFYDHYFNNEGFSDLAKKYKLKFPSSAVYIIKKCEKKCREIANS